MATFQIVYTAPGTNSVVSAPIVVSPSGSTVPNLSALPAVNLTTPQFITTAQITALNMPNKALHAAGRYSDPISSVPVTRVTNSTYPVAANTGCTVPYVAPGLWVSRAWGASLDMHTLAILVRTPSFVMYFVDYQRGTGICSNPRSSSLPIDQQFVFSSDPAVDARICYYFTGSSIVRFNSAVGVMAAAPLGNFPKTGLVGNNWLQSSKDDRYFFWHQGVDPNPKTLWWWDSQTNTLRSRAGICQDEAYLERDGRYVLTNNNPIYLWDAVNDTILSSGVSPGGNPYFVHVGALRSLWVSGDNFNGPYQGFDYRYRPWTSGESFTTQARTQLPGHQVSGNYHNCGSWVQSTADNQQYWLSFPYDHGTAVGNAPGGTLPVNHGQGIPCSNGSILAHDTLVFRRADGLDARVLGVSLQRYNGSEYYEWFGGQSADGKLVVASTSMGVIGRTDIFAYEVPLA